MTGSIGVPGGVGRAGACPRPRALSSGSVFAFAGFGAQQGKQHFPLLGEGLSLWWGRGRPWELRPQQSCSELSQPMSESSGRGWQRQQEVSRHRPTDESVEIS